MLVSVVYLTSLNKMVFYTQTGREFQCKLGNNIKGIHLYENLEKNCDHTTTLIYNKSDYQVEAINIKWTTIINSMLDGSPCMYCFPIFVKQSDILQLSFVINYYLI